MAPREPVRFPSRVMSNTEKSYFVFPTPPLNVSVPSCKGVRVEDFNSTFPLGTKNYTSEQLYDAYTGKLAFRVGKLEVYQGLYGLGNNLQGMFTAFVIALLSGRQLLISPGGNNPLPMQTMSRAFQTGVGWTDGFHEHRIKTTWLNIRNPDLSIPDPVLLMKLNDFRDVWWTHDPARKKCVFDAMGCNDLWCARSRFYTYLIKKGSKELERAIAKYMSFEPAPTRYSAATRRNMAETNSTADSSAGAAPTPSAPTPSPNQTPSPTPVPFHGPNPTPGHTPLPLPLPTPAPAPAPIHSPSLSPPPMSPPPSPSPSPPPPSNPPPAAKDAKTADNDFTYEGCPLCLKFDIAIHLRTKSECIEKAKADPSLQCHDKGLSGAIDGMGREDRLRGTSWVRRFGCIMHHLTVLLKMKLRRQLEANKKKRKYKGLMHDERDRKEYEEVLKAKHHFMGRRPQDNPLFNGTYKKVKSLSPASKFTGKLEGLGHWTVEDSEFLAQKAWDDVIAEYYNETGDNSTTQQKPKAGLDMTPFAELEDLNILLATDAEFMRPLYVEFLRPFGMVSHSKGQIVHLLFKKGADDIRLATLGEFYLMSRSSILLGHPPHRSYSYTAALYGNNTIAWGSDQEHCSYFVEHVAISQKR